MSASVTQVFQKKSVLKEQERLMTLFSNRAELKRAYGQQRGKAERLAEKLHQQEVATLRAEQYLEKVESMLADPGTAIQAVTFYQCRALWAHCRKRMQRFAAEMYEIQTEREHQLFIRDHRSQRELSLQEVRQQLNEIGEQGDALREQMQELEVRRDALTGFWNFFRRRQLDERVAEFDMARNLVGQQVAQLMTQSEQAAATEAPRFPGLSIAGKRVVNVQLIAFAQELYLWFREAELPELAREASICQVTDVRYGDRGACTALTDRLALRTKELGYDNNLAIRTHERAAWLAKELDYRHETDTIPESAGLAQIIVSVREPSQYAPVPVNVLAQEYWDIIAALVPSSSA